MHNKKHLIIDDAWDMDSDTMGGSAHTLRVGLVINTVINSTPVVIPDIRELVQEGLEVKVDNIKDQLPILLHFGYNGMQVSILIVHDKDTDNIQCYPFSDIQDGRHWWLYEMAFDLVKHGHIEVRPVHPLVDYGDPTKEMMDHLEALATIVSTFLARLNEGSIFLEEETDDFSKINKKRIKGDKTPIVNNWTVKYVSNQNS